MNQVIFSCGVSGVHNSETSWVLNLIALRLVCNFKMDTSFQERVLPKQYGILLNQILLAE